MEETGLIGSIIGNPFLRGLTIGLLVALILWVRATLKIRELNSQLKKLREHLHTKLEIDSEENERRKGELDKIKQERDNLRNMVQVVNQKPGRQELRQTQVYQKAIEIMFEKSPGFAPAWQITLKEAEEEIKQAEKGIIPFFKRMTTSSATAQGKPGKRHLELEESTGN
ncbi:LapA family protein [Desulfogranum mediterraneum]|uniref:LapA family protein n=1 Tax=Desulfogranum mediterraneum TaxID=160661 RepID=UPI0004064577|nr:LapA family protein [Desulfogranum mediterraneum]